MLEKEIFFNYIDKYFSEVVSETKQELILLCPYIKINALKKILSGVKRDVKITVVVRWKIEDIVFGSSDLDVYSFLKNYNCVLYFNHKIHLKVIVSDNDSVVIGSANITNSGMGISKNPNIEIITIRSIDKVSLLEIKRIINNSTKVDEKLINYLREQVSLCGNFALERERVKRKIDNVNKDIVNLYKRKIELGDFIFSKDPISFINEIRKEKPNQSAIHDLEILDIQKEISEEDLKSKFISSKCYQWQLCNVNDTKSFGGYSEIIHSNLSNKERVYRKDVKNIVSNMFRWTDYFSEDYDVLNTNNSVLMIKKYDKKL